MPAVVELRVDFDARYLRLLAKRCRDAKQSRRLLSIAAVYDGMNRSEAARIIRSRMTGFTVSMPLARTVLWTVKRRVPGGD